MWQIEIYTNRKWVAYGNPTSDFPAAYAKVGKLSEVGNKVRLRRIV